MASNGFPNDRVQRNDIYANRMPSPPRLSLPPPPDSASEFVIQSALENPWHPSLRLYNWDAYARPPDLVEWRYSDRRLAQLILPYLYLGPLTSAKDVDFLRSEGITMVLAILSTAAQAMSAALRAAASCGTEVKTISVASYNHLIPVFTQVSSIISDHLLQTAPTGAGKILVVCESGNERSATVVAAHILERYRGDTVQAVNVVHQRRFSVNIDDQLRTKLFTYHGLVVAQAMVTSSDSAGGQAKSNKRNFDDGDEDMSNAEDAPQGRRTFNPFNGAFSG